MAGDWFSRNAAGGSDAPRDYDAERGGYQTYRSSPTRPEAPREYTSERGSYSTMTGALPTGGYPTGTITRTAPGALPPVNTTQPVGTPVQATAPGYQAGAPAPTGGDPMQLIAQWQQELPPSPDSIGIIAERLRAAGIQAALATHEGGTKASSDAIVLPDGRVLDLVVGWDGPNPTWGLQHVDNYDLSRNVVGANGAMVPFSEYLGGLGLPMPTAKPFAGPGGAAGGGAGGNLGALAGIDPSYGFLFGEGQKAIEKSAAAKGTLLTGGTLKALTRYGQGMASTEFGNIFDRNYKLAGLGLNAAHGAASSGTSYSGQATNAGNNFATNQSNLLTGQGDVNAAGQAGQANAWGGTLGNLANIWGGYLARRNGGSGGAGGAGGAVYDPMRGGMFE